VTWLLAGVVVAVVVLYHVLRLMASQCTGAACDSYIPFSLFLPIIAILLAAVTAGVAVSEARANKLWAMVIGICGVLASAGSILAALAIEDNDTKVWIATALVLSVPVIVLLYGSTHRTSIKA
jgi:hypothetical protein